MHLSALRSKFNEPQTPVATHKKQSHSSQDCEPSEEGITGWLMRDGVKCTSVTDQERTRDQPGRKPPSGDWLRATSMTPRATTTVITVASTLCPADVARTAHPRIPSVRKTRHTRPHTFNTDPPYTKTPRQSHPTFTRTSSPRSLSVRNTHHIRCASQRLTVPNTLAGRQSPPACAYTFAMRPRPGVPITCSCLQIEPLDKSQRWFLQGLSEDQGVAKGELMRLAGKAALTTFATRLEEVACATGSRLH